jgi:hypothetical protein
MSAARQCPVCGADVDETRVLGRMQPRDRSDNGPNTVDPLKTTYTMHPCGHELDEVQSRMWVRSGH